jgi:hypothetical protein
MMITLSRSIVAEQDGIFSSGDHGDIDIGDLQTQLLELPGLQLRSSYGRTVLYLVAHGFAGVSTVAVMYRLAYFSMLQSLLSQVSN